MEELDEVAVVVLVEVVVIVVGSSVEASLFEHRVAASTEVDAGFVFELTRSMVQSSSAVSASSPHVIAELLGPGSSQASPVVSAAESTWMHLSELDLGLSSIRMIFVAGLEISEESASSAEASASESGRLCIYTVVNTERKNKKQFR